MKKKIKPIYLQAWDKLTIDSLEDILSIMRGPNNRKKLTSYINRRLQNVS